MSYFQHLAAHLFCASHGVRGVAVRCVLDALATLFVLALQGRRRTTDDLRLVRARRTHPYSFKFAWAPRNSLFAIMSGCQFSIRSIYGAARARPRARCPSLAFLAATVDLLHGPDHIPTVATAERRPRPRSAVASPSSAASTDIVIRCLHGLEILNTRPRSRAPAPRVSQAGYSHQPRDCRARSPSALSRLCRSADGPSRVGRGHGCATGGLRGVWPGAARAAIGGAAARFRSGFEARKPAWRGSMRRPFDPFVDFIHHRGALAQPRPS
jgi:hypothetical protein